MNIIEIKKYAKLSTIMAVLIVGTINSFGEVPRPEHPRPDLFRENWMTLNGEWQFEIDRNADGETRGLISGKDLNSKIIVPFCPESKLSGIGLGNTERLKDVWYRRMFDIPASMKGKRIRLHFGAVDYKAWVYINGQPVGTHIGENVAFNFDITKFLKDGSNELVVRVLDDMTTGLQPAGKQAFNKSEGCVYTRTTGIWQPVWLEAVGSSFVENISVVSDPDNSRVLIEVTINGLDSNLKLEAKAFADGRQMGSDSTTATWRNPRLVLNLKKKKLWDPGSPFLYDLQFILYRGKEKIDEMKSYFGLRKVTIDGRRILINGKPIFQRLILDQGFYPEGIWTAPTDEALKKDIEMCMACGYNGARLHQKVFEPRFLYWADKLGYLVWGEYPNWGYNYKPEGYSAYVNEWTEILIRDRNHPSIVGWCPFNESGAGAGEVQQIIWNVTKAVDPTRPALETSGWTHTLPHPEVRDAHDYDGNPETFRKRWMDYFTAGKTDPVVPARYGRHVAAADCGVPFMVSEIGGIGWATEGGWGYGSGPKTLDEFYIRYKGTCDALLDNPNMFGFCYTQLTDIEQEKNGLYYYDRKPKFDVKKLHEITSRQAAYERGEPVAPQPGLISEPGWKVLIGAVQDGKLCTPYRYSTEKPADEWMKEGFDDSVWKTGLAPFGHDERRRTRTEWKTGDIYLRKTFEYDGRDLKHGAVVISHDEDTDVFINGQKILGVTKFISHYQMHIVTDQLKKALKKGVNTIAVHTHQSTGGQFIDLALLVD
ncbi:MAG: glycoside hydrolase family 2 TIM barrel-domain containing protein [Kiritimatiellae bacterium]|nr:glycoside hydrolase family 2 TIM barrel-domain containing protein [Kiritimatiellia bacterium]MDD5522554.1 glycoside hydrolase family 2 TIM barrel-domain containing protein [Kiritimatiellia bacterium]